MAEDHTIVVESPSRGAGAGWIVALVVVVALMIGGVFLSQMSNSQVAKDNAITNAANNVGDAAKHVGDAAKNVGDSTSDGPNK